ncbi:MAG: hypothetical protein Q7S98_06090 [Deltaproteobacteria bacterium]|nr:hypothetical protein [Deltaproteobacteria bacterium]
MANPGDYVITQSVGQNAFGYFEPKPACSLRHDLSGLEKKTVARALAQQKGDLKGQVAQINKGRPDVNRDGLPDQFVLEETPDLFIIKLSRGATHSDVVDGCADGADNRYAGFEKEPQMILQIPKTGGGERVSVDKIAWVNGNWPGEYGHLVLSGMVFRSADNHSDKKLWDLFFTQCPEDRSYIPCSQGECL